ncbi:hypothetical protein KFK09_028336 [Dendrobium nobile]|uniref:Uncharacterized protein n=1 Tax=Dendrobium nobile TaxID=94219 RepID=A0A8T3A324_DENNO|nr:hypothetical protein KFK09_028336 [Dendrobium nobile]
MATESCLPSQVPATRPPSFIGNSKINLKMNEKLSSPQHLEDRMKKLNGPLVIRDVSEAEPRKIIYVKGKGKGVVDSESKSTPGTEKSHSGMNLLDPEASSTGMKLFVNRFVNSSINSDIEIKQNPVKMSISNTHEALNLENNLDVDKVIDKMQTYSGKVGINNTWSNKPYIKIDFKEDESMISEDGKAVKMNEALEIKNSEKLSNSIVIKVFGRELASHLVAWEIRRQWKHYGQFHFTTLGKGWFLCSFKSEEMMEAVLSGGPWFINGHIVGMERWSTEFSANSMKGLTSPIWVRMPNLPLQCWDEDNIARIASKIGIPLMMDGNLFQWGRREFARICVANLCFECGVIRHLKNVCGNISNKACIDKLGASFSSDVDSRSKEHIAADKPTYGPWILVNNKKGRKPIHKSIAVKSSKAMFVKKVGNEKVTMEEGNEGADGRFITPIEDPVLSNEDHLEEGELIQDKEQPIIEKSNQVEEGRDCFSKDNEGPMCKSPISFCSKLSNSGNKFDILSSVPENLVNEDLLLSAKDKEITVKSGDGLSGGIMILWRSDVASFSVLKEDDQCIIGDLNIFDKGEWMIATVYGNKDVMKRRELWSNLEEVSNRKLPFIVGGDFNCILSQDDKRCGRKFAFSKSPKEMADFLNMNDLHDVGFVVVRHLARIASDHCPIVLKILDNPFQKLGIIKFEDVWISFKASSLIIQRVWRKTFQGNDMEILNKKCRRALKDLFYWSKARIKDFSLEKEKLKEEISLIKEEEASVGWLSNEKLWELRSKVFKLNSMLSRLNTYWRQRAKAKWIVEGDSNSKFFHSFANSRRIGKRISQIKDVDGAISEDPLVLQQILFQFFQKKWKQRECYEEILEVIKGLGNNISPGHDGIMSKSWKETLIVLIPKISNPLSPEAFHLISLCNSIYKVVAKEGKDLGIKVASSGNVISHLLYADDILLFSKAKISSIKEMKIILSSYCGSTGQKINHKKSSMIISKNVDRRMKNKIKKIMEIKMVEEMDYLGSKLALRRLKKADFQFLLDKALKTLNAWSNRYISIVGKLVLVNSVFSNLHLYLISHSLIPLSVLREFEKFCRNYIWKNQDGKQGMHYIAWDELCKPRANGGWGIHSANLVSNPNSFLNINLLIKYGEDWWKKDVIKGGSTALKIIASGWKSMRKIIRWNVVNGMRINVLKNIWIFDKILLKWPTFLTHFDEDDLTLDFFILDGHWDIEKLLLFFGNELVCVISSIHIIKEGDEDFMYLKYKLTGKSIAAMIKEDSTKVPEGSSYLWIHKLNLYSKVEFFIWRLCKNAIPTSDFLFKRKLSIDNKCPRGCGGIEDVDHISTTCPKLRKVIDILRDWGFLVPFFDSFQHCLEEAKKSLEKNPGMIKLYFTQLLFSWSDRNKLKHGKKEDSVLTLASNVISLIAFDRRKNLLSDNWDAFQSIGLSFDSWHPPPPEWYKINIDAALKSNYGAGIGGVVRDYRGRMIRAFGFYGMHWDISQLELYSFFSLKYLLHNCLDEAKGVIIEGDNKNVIHFLQELYSKGNNKVGIMEDEDFYGLRSELGVKPRSFNGPLVIRENCFERMKISSLDIGKRKQVNLDSNVVSPSSNYNVISNYLESSSSGMKIFVNQFGNNENLAKGDPLVQKTGDNTSDVRENVQVETEELNSLPIKNVQNPWIKHSHIIVNLPIGESLSADGKAVKLFQPKMLENSRKLQKSIVVKVFGRANSVQIIAAELRHQWSQFGKFHGRRELARVCVHLELDKQLSMGVRVDGLEGSTNIIYSDPAPKEQNAGIVNAPREELNYGPWVHVNYKKKRSLKETYQKKVVDSKEVSISLENPIPPSVSGVQQFEDGLEAASEKDKITEVGVTSSNEDVAAMMNTISSPEDSSRGIIVLWKANMEKFSLLDASPQCVIGELSIHRKVDCGYSLWQQGSTFKKEIVRDLRNEL